MALLEGRGPSPLGPSCQLVSSICKPLPVLYCTASGPDVFTAKSLGCTHLRLCGWQSANTAVLQLRTALSLSTAAARRDTILAYRL